MIKAFIAAMLTILLIVGIVAMSTVYEDRKALTNNMLDIEHTKLKIILQQEINKELELKNKLNGGK